MTFNTGNNVPSTDPRDLYDNAENLDKLVNGADPFYADRLGKMRESWSGMENSFTNAQEGRETTFTLSQADKESRFQAFLVSSGYVSKGDYAAGVVLAERNEYVAVDAATTGTSPGLYRPNASATLPLTLTGTWATDAANLVLLGDDVLRQELADPNAGAALVARASITVASVAELLSRTPAPDKAYAVAGYHEGSTSGGGLFMWSAGTPKSQHNGGTVIDPARPFPSNWANPTQIEDWFASSTSGSGCFVRMDSERPSALMFGAKGDGVSDDSAVLQKYVDLSNSNGWHSLYLPTHSFDYLLTDSIKQADPDYSIFGDNGILLRHPAPTITRKGSLIVADSAPCALDLGAYRTGATSLNPAGSWLVRGVSIRSESDSRAANGIEFSGLQNGPDRPVAVRDVSCNGLDNAIYMPAAPAGVTITVANLSVDNFSAYACNRGIFSEGEVYGLSVTNSNLEGNVEGCVWGKFTGPVNISNNMLENTKNPVNLHSEAGIKLIARGNYFEYHPTSDYLLRVRSDSTYANNDIEIFGNFISGIETPSIPVRLSGAGRWRVDSQYPVLLEDSGLLISSGSTIFSKHGGYRLESLDPTTITAVYVDDGFNRFDDGSGGWSHHYPSDPETYITLDTPIGKAKVVDLADGINIGGTFTAGSAYALTFLIKVEADTDPTSLINIYSVESQQYITSLALAGQLGPYVSLGSWVVVSIPIVMASTWNGLKFTASVTGKFRCAGVAKRDCGALSGVTPLFIPAVCPNRQ